MWSAELSAFALMAGLKLLLLPAYRSTDFEVHRNWMAITSSLPRSEWYVDATSEWTLDYPPLFAWCERALGELARLVEPAMVEVRVTPYASFATIAYQRGTVIATDALLFIGARSLARACALPADRARTAPTVLAVCSAGLLLVDHIHFQYNGALIGLLLLSLAHLRAGRPVIASLLFSLLLNLKHLFLFAAPLYFVHLLRHHVVRVRDNDDANDAAAPTAARRARSPRRRSASPARTHAARPRSAAPPRTSHRARALWRLCGIGAPVVAVFALSFGPFHRELSHVLSRLFPFKRGLVHAYWAPNFWAVYVAADTLGGALGRAAMLLPPRTGAATAGLVGVTPFHLLPPVGPTLAALCVLCAQLPLLFHVARRRRADAAAAAFAPAVAYAGLAAVLFGYHVHEKALLPPLLVLTALPPPRATATPRATPRGAAHVSKQSATDPYSSTTSLHARLVLILSTTTHVALLPLLHQPAEHLLSRAAVALYYVGGYIILRERCAPPPTSPSAERRAPTLHAGTPSVGLRWYERTYLIGFIVLDLYVSALHQALLGSRLPFVPLALTSLYCAVGVHYCAVLALQLYLAVADS